MAPVVVFQTLAYTGRDQLSASLVDQIKQQDGFKRAFFGPKIEDRTKGVLATGTLIPVPTLTTTTNKATEWSSTAAALAYRSSNLVASDEQLAIELASPGLSEPYGQTLDAPCTELFTAYGIEDVFVENTGKFLGLIKETEGFLGAQFGEAVGRGEGEERAARVVIGWRQKEDHDRSKADAESGEYPPSRGLVRDADDRSHHEEHRPDPTGPQGGGFVPCGIQAALSSPFCYPTRHIGLLLASFTLNGTIHLQFAVS